MARPKMTTTLLRLEGSRVAGLRPLWHALCECGWDGGLHEPLLVAASTANEHEMLDCPLRAAPAPVTP